jgi:hypothetical protein
MKMYVGVDVQIRVFLTLALIRGEWWSSLPGHFTPREWAPGTNWMEGWVGHRASLDDVEKRRPYWDSNSDPSVVQSVVSLYTDCAILAPYRD